MSPRLLPRVDPRKRIKYIREIPGWARYLITRARYREIRRMAIALKLPEGVIERYFNSLKAKGMGAVEIGEKITHDLNEMQKLIAATKPDIKGMRAKLQRLPLEDVLQEMRDRLEAVQAQGRAA